MDMEPALNAIRGRRRVGAYDYDFEARSTDGGRLVQVSANIPGEEMFVEIITMPAFELERVPEIMGPAWVVMGQLARALDRSIGRIQYSKMYLPAAQMFQEAKKGEL
jgi:hypothetical protein